MKKVFSRKELLKDGMHTIRLTINLAEEAIVYGDRKKARRFLARASIEASFLADLGLISYEKEDLLRDIIIRTYNNF
ncbi:MAG: hypothetical protein K2K56_06890 [Lachnospiraceae bacterium]|nr:hypothetical protein [Lachnospiraceae bacterium]